MKDTAPEAPRPHLVSLNCSAVEARFTVRHSQGRPLDLVAPLPLLVRLAERDMAIDVDILSLDQSPLYGFTVPTGSPEGQALLLELAHEVLEGSFY